MQSLGRVSSAATRPWLPVVLAVKEPAWTRSLVPASTTVDEPCEATRCVPPRPWRIWIRPPPPWRSFWIHPSPSWSLWIRKSRCHRYGHRLPFLLVTRPGTHPHARRWRIGTLKNRTAYNILSTTLIADIYTARETSTQKYRLHGYRLYSYILPGVIINRYLNGHAISVSDQNNSRY
jgi:hypothetical protein